MTTPPRSTKSKGSGEYLGGEHGDAPSPKQVGTWAFPPQKGKTGNSSGREMHGFHTNLKQPKSQR